MSHSAPNPRTSKSNQNDLPIRGPLSTFVTTSKCCGTWRTSHSPRTAWQNESKPRKNGWDNDSKPMELHLFNRATMPSTILDFSNFVPFGNDSLLGFSATIDLALSHYGHARILYMVTTTRGKWNKNLEFIPCVRQYMIRYDARWPDTCQGLTRHFLQGTHGCTLAITRVSGIHVQSRKDEGDYFLCFAKTTKNYFKAKNLHEW